MAHAQELSTSAPPANEDNYSQQYVSSYPVDTPPKAQFAPPSGFDPCSCLSAIQNWTDFPRGIGKPDNVQPRYSNPVVGSVVITNEGPYGHVGLVMSITPDEITIKEANYRPCAVGFRTIRRDSSLIRGYW